MRASLSILLAAGIFLVACVATSDTRSGVKDDQNSERYLVEQVKENPHDPEALIRLGFYYYRFENNAYKARRFYERALKESGRKVYTGPHYYLGLALKDLKEYDGAIREFQDCLLVPPEDAADDLVDKFYRFSHLRLAEIYAEVKLDTSRAEDHLRKFIELGAEEPLLMETHRLMARVYVVEKKDPVKAAEHLERYRDLGGDAQRARKIQEKIDALVGSLKDKEGAGEGSGL